MNSTFQKLWQTYQVVNEWIRFADTKAAVVIAINGILMGFVVTNLPSLKVVLLGYKWLLIISIFAALSNLLSTYFSIKCLNPTLNVGEPNSLIYYAHIALQFDSYNEYYQETKEVFADEVESTKQIASQVWANSKVAWKKYKAITWSTRFLVLSIILGVVGFIVSII